MYKYRERIACIKEFSRSVGNYIIHTSNYFIHNIKFLQSLSALTSEPGMDHPQQNITAKQ